MMPSPALPHDNKSPWVIAAMVPLILATLLCVSARFYARWILRRTLGLDDGIMLISAVCASRAFEGAKPVLLTCCS